MKRLSLRITLLFVPLLTMSQNITLDICQQKARELYPLTKQYGLIEKTSEYNIANANKAWLPQVNFTAKATYQSETFCTS
jgi:outer membrane protein TolC